MVKVNLVSVPDKDGCYCQKCGASVDSTDEKCPNGHVLAEVGRNFIRSAPATMRVRASIDVIFVRGPLNFLEDAINEKRFLEGVVVSQTFLERFGTDRLKEYFKNEKVSVEIIKIKEWRNVDRERMLEGLGIISQSICYKMEDVRRYRNYIVHELRNPGLIDEKESRRIIEKAIECLKALGAN